MRISWLICLLACFVSAQGALINNGGFELGTFVDDGNGTDSFLAGPTTITGWTAVGRQVSWIRSPNPWLLSAEEGTHFLDLTGYQPGPPFGGVTETIATNVGQQYDLSFFLGSYTQRWGGPPVAILASAGSTSQTFTVTTTSTASTWTPFSMLFTATSPNTAITLTGAAGVEYVGLDNVSVDLASSVPEPNSWVLMMLGLGLVGSMGLWRYTSRSVSKS